MSGKSPIVVAGVAPDRFDLLVHGLLRRIPLVLLVPAIEADPIEVSVNGIGVAPDVEQVSGSPFERLSYEAFFGHGEKHLRGGFQYHGLRHRQVTFAAWCPTETCEEATGSFHIYDGPSIDEMVLNGIAGGAQIGMPTLDDGDRRKATIDRVLCMDGDREDYRIWGCLGPRPRIDNPALWLYFVASYNNQSRSGNGQYIKAVTPLVSFE